MILLYLNNYDSFISLLVKRWSMDQQHQHLLAALLKCRSSDHLPDSQNRNLHFTKTPSNLYSHVSLRSPCNYLIYSSLQFDISGKRC